MDRKSWSKTRYSGKSSKSKTREYRKIEREYSTIESIVELKIQQDDVNKEMKLMKKERDTKLRLKIQNFL